MHAFYTMLALDLANERAAEAEREYILRRGVREQRSGLRRRLSDAVRGLRSMFDDAMPTERRTRPRIQTGHTH